MADPYFREVDGYFVGNDPARGPWSEHHCHAGPVAALAVRGAEHAAGPEKVLTRLTLDITRPLPLAGLAVEIDVTRATRTLATTRIAVRDRDGTVCATGSTMHLVRKSLGDVPTAEISSPRLSDSEVLQTPLVGALHDKPVFGQFVDMALPKGQKLGLGPKVAWMRAPRLLDGEETSPIQSLCPLADSGNGISFNAFPDVLGFMNTDLTLYVHREPMSLWVASDVKSHWESNGVGLSHAVLHDEKGAVGVALQSLVLHPPSRT